MLDQLNIYGKTKLDVAIERIKRFEPPEGYYVAFSGGKDSVVVKALCDMAGVKYDAHYNITTVDPPELVQFIKTFPDVSMEHARYSDGSVVTMWNLIPKKKLPPTRIARYCCDYLKERSGKGRFVITGVRQAESTNRKNRGGLEVADTKSQKERERLDPDNPDQQMIHICQTKAQRILNPIIDWTNEEVWEFIRAYDIPYCKLYDQGETRLGCIGCPMNPQQQQQLAKYPKYKQAYLRAFDKMLKQMDGSQTWKTAEEVMKWWLQEEK